MSTAPALHISAGVNRRREPRRPHRAVVIMPWGEGVDAHFETAELTDVSPGGVGLETAHAIKAGNPFFLRIDLARTVLAVYTVCHCDAISVGFHIGAQYTGLVGVSENFCPGRHEVFAALSNLKSP